jgi:uncharacterized protein (DUF305 family)
MKIILALVIGILIGILVAPLIPVGTLPDYGMMSRSSMMGNMDMDANFIEQMIPHHEDAITMAEIALEKAEHEEIKQLARNIQVTQTEEIEKMQRWYKEWYGREVTFITQARAHVQGTFSYGMMGDNSDIARLENAPDFDKVFIEEMIPHHQMAVMMAQMLKQSTNRREMNQLADDIINAQTREINQMRGWYRTWYGLNSD